MTIYQEEGFDSRRAYLVDLADSFGVNKAMVFSLANLLGKIEDFDGLITSLKDIEAGDGGFHGGWDGD